MRTRVLAGLLCWLLYHSSSYAATEGRVYLMTNSVSANVTRLHIVNSSSSAQSFTGTLYNGSGEQLGSANVALHNGVVSPQGRVILGASDLETLFNTTSWSGPALLQVNGEEQFDLMSKLTSPSGLVSNTNCVREGAVHNIEGFDSSNNTFVRFINTGDATLTNITGTLRDEDGNVIGNADSTIVSSLAPNAATFVNRVNFRDLVGSEWNGVASLELSSDYEGLRLLNLNFVNGETFFNFSCFENESSGNVYLMTPSTSGNVSETHLVNTSDEAVTFSATGYTREGDQIGAAESSLHTGTIDPDGRLIISASDIESATGADAWGGPALIEIQSTGSSYELMTKLTSASGLVSNTNCVRKNSVHNIEGFDSPNNTFVRFINTGDSAITNIRGTLYDESGTPIGTEDTLLIDSLGAKVGEFINRAGFRDLFGTTWNGEASLVVTADDDTNLQLLNLNFVNGETFFNFSCYEASEETVTAESFFQSNISQQVIQDKCVVCHKDGGVAGATPLIYAETSDPDHESLNFQLISAYIEENSSRAQTMLDKSRGVAHGGGAVLSSSDQEYQDLETFLALLGAEIELADQQATSEFWQGVSMSSARQTLRRASLMLRGTLPSDAEYQSVASGTDAAMETAIRSMMTGDGFHDFLIRGSNDRLLTDAFVTGSINFPAITTNNLFFPRVANRHYDENVEAGGQGIADQIWISEWGWAMARAPLELIAYVVEQDLSYQEILTADYMMVNFRSNELLDAGAQFDGEDLTVYKPGLNRGQITADPFYTDIADSFGVKVLTFEDYLDYPHAGILNTHAFLNRYPSTETNRNRARARWTYYNFLGVDIEKSASRTTDPDALADTDNPTLNNGACTVCHEVMDPVAGAFQNYGNEGHYREFYVDSLPDTYKYPVDADGNNLTSLYQEGDTWYRDMRDPGFNNAIAPDSTNSLQWLANEIVNDPRFAVAAVKFWWKPIFGADPIEAPEDSNDSDFTTRLAAFEAQNRFIEDLGEQFAAGIDGGTPYNAKDLLTKMIASNWYRADAVEDSTVSARLVADFGSRRLLSPEELEKKAETVLGIPWFQFDTEYLIRGKQTYLVDNLGAYYGGIDSGGITERPDGLTSLMANVAEMQALQMSCVGVMSDFHVESAQRTFLQGIEPTDTPDTSETIIREKLVELHFRFLGEELTTNDPEIDATYELLTESWVIRLEQNAEYWDSVNHWPDEVCASYLPGFYDEGGPMDVTAHDPTGMKNVWWTVVIYLMSDYAFLHE